MTHMVIFRHPEGKPGYHQADNLDEAVRFVERLRNQEHVTDARIFRMEEVPIEFRTYYKVELGNGSSPKAPAPARTEHSRGMAVVHHNQRVMPLGEVTDLRQPGHVAVHREDAVGGNEPQPTARGLLQALFQLAHR